MSITIFGNFRVDSEERFLRLKDSFYSFKNAKISKWIINIRGPLKRDVINFLSDNLGNSLQIFQLESNAGWLYDSYKLTSHIESKYVMIWIEDHICVCGEEKFNLVVDDLVSNKVDYIGYSWFGNGLFLDEFRGISQTNCNAISIIDYDYLSNSKRQINAIKTIGSKSYIISLCGIFSKRFYINMLLQKKPYLLRWPRKTPFNFEKSYDDTFILPIKYGVPKFELFSPIDDDNKHKGSSLVSRGLYPNRVSRESMVSIRENFRKKRWKNIPAMIKKNILAIYLYEIYRKILFTIGHD